MFDLTGKTALITGASSGLGASFAKVLSNNGARVVITARRWGRSGACSRWPRPPRGWAWLTPPFLR